LQRLALFIISYAVWEKVVNYLVTSIGQTLAEGNVTMDGENYSLWNGDNNDAYSYIAAELNLTLI
jgi:hypothetical protein